MINADGSGIVAELLTDYLWKVGIVVVLAALAVVAMVAIWRRTGTSRERIDRDAQDH